jgi:nucleotide-binding universal stress UspA family protein
MAGTDARSAAGWGAGRVEVVMRVGVVLCPTDFSPLSHRAAGLAADLCRRFGARLVLEHNLEARPPAYLGVTWMWSETHETDGASHEALAERRLRDLLAELPASVEREARLTRGPIDLSLLRLIDLVHADLVVMGTRGASSLAHRSLTERLLSRAACPLVTLSEEARRPAFFAQSAGPTAAAGRILVPCDFTEHARAAAREAVDLAATLGASLVFLHVEAPTTSARLPEGETARRSERLRQFESRVLEVVPRVLHDRVECRTESGWPSEEILRCAREAGAGLIVMGCHRKGMLGRVLAGVTSHDVMHRSPCPVWFVPAGRRVRSAAA